MAGIDSALSLAMRTVSLCKQQRKAGEYQSTSPLGVFCFGKIQATQTQGETLPQMETSSVLVISNKVPKCDFL